MDAGIADTINRQVAAAVAAHCDAVDAELFKELLLASSMKPWYVAPMADTFMGTNDATNGDRAWLFGVLAARTPGVDIDTIPADFDWENLFGSFRAEILARRDPETPPVLGQAPVRDGVGSR